MKKEDRLSVYDEVTNRIVAELERGVAPWAKPWDESRCRDVSIPRNTTTGRAYSGVNVVLLWMLGPPGAPLYLTYKQAAACGAQVREGEHGFRVVYADSHVKTEEHNGETHIVFAYSFLKRYTVFHTSQVDNLPAKFTAAGEPVPPFPDADFEAFVGKIGARVCVGGGQCCYYREQDAIGMPPWPVFHTLADYKATMLHELVHWTGAPNRLNRPKGGKSYAFEELVAEIGAAFLCATLGVVGKLQHSEYIGHYAKALKADNREIFRACAAAQRAADYLLGLAGANQLQAAE
jgi:antirestriction protein ArdC